MDLVSFESQDEYEWVKQRMGGKQGLLIKIHQDHVLTRQELAL